MSDGLTAPIVESVAHGFRVLSSASRLRVLAALLSTPGTPSELAERTGLGPSTVSRHLTALAGESFVAADPDDPSGRYRLSDPRIAALLSRVCGRLVRECESQAHLFA